MAIYLQKLVIFLCFIKIYIFISRSVDVCVNPLIRYENKHFHMLRQISFYG
jgi:hypothetical protein